MKTSILGTEGLPPDVDLPDTPSVLYIDLPTEHEGTQLKWTLKKKTQKYWHSYSVYGNKIPVEDDFDAPGLGSGWVETETVFTLTMTLDQAGEEIVYSENVEDILDKDIIATAKTLINRKERNFRNLLLDNGDVQIWPKPKK